jgi:hypothetical protein
LEFVMRVSRRELLAGTGTVAAMGIIPRNAANALTGGLSINAANSLNWACSADVVVVGGGVAGLKAALAARAKGASVTVVDAAAGLPAEKTAPARRAGVEFLEGARLTAIHREGDRTGAVVGARFDAGGRSVDVRAGRSLVLATGSDAARVNFRRFFDPRLGEEFPKARFDHRDSRGELAAMASGVALSGSYRNLPGLKFSGVEPFRVGAQFPHAVADALPKGAAFDAFRAKGLPVRGWNGVALVNARGARFVDEALVDREPLRFLQASMIKGDGAVWALFDSATAERQGWNIDGPDVVEGSGFFFGADTPRELADKMEAGGRATSPGVLKATLDQAGIGEGGIYAAWATPFLYERRVGLRVDGRGRALDAAGRAIAGLRGVSRPEVVSA